MARTFKDNRFGSSPRPGNERERQAKDKRDKRREQTVPYSRKERRPANWQGVIEGPRNEA